MDISEKYKGKRKWVRFLAEWLDCYFQHDVGKSAAALTYYLVFAMFPFLIFLSMLLGFLKLPLIPLTGQASNLLPEDIIMILNIGIVHITERRSSAVLAVGLIFTLWPPMRAVHSLMDSINHAYGGEKYPSLLRYRLLTFLFTLCIILFIVVAMLILLIGEGVLGLISKFWPLSLNFIALWGKLRFIPLGVMLYGILASLYYVAPNPRPAKRYVFPGAIAALVTWLIFSMGFAYYVDNLANYSVIYGSIGAIIVFLMWLYFSGVVILMGAEFNHALMTVYG